MPMTVGPHLSRVPSFPHVWEYLQEANWRRYLALHRPMKSGDLRDRQPGACALAFGAYRDLRPRAGRTDRQRFLQPRSLSC
jgi:hypothetical protein